MPSRLWVLWVGGLVLGLASPCPPPCACPPQALECRGCPTDYLAVSSDTLSLAVSGCRDILYLLRLHRALPPDKHVGKFSLQKLQITDSLIEKIPESYVNNDYSIQSLVMSNNSIQTLDVGLEASNLTYLDLSRNYLSFIKNRTFERMNNIVYLDLGSNRLENMSVQAFGGLSKLVHLDLCRNNLTYLMDAIFLPLVSLQRLNLSSNKLEALSEKCFGSLLLLQQLDISYNRLTSVAPGTLQFLPNLAKLLLADNPQLRPDAQIFVGTGRRLQQVDASRTGLRRVPEALTHSVRYLSLAGNRITTLRCGDLDGYPLLHMLDFADNIIENVEDDALGRLEMISRLYLNRNKLQTVPKMLPDKLSYLSLDTNLIQNLTIADFATLGGLKVLLLSNNLISFIQENTFMQLISLEVLDVSNNPLKALTPNTFGGPVSLKDFRIAFVDISPPAKDISFPVPSPEGMERLHLQHSAGLARELLADTAALAAMSRLQYLDISYSAIVNIRSDLLHFWPQLKYLRLEGNNINCSELNWLAQWMRDNMDNEFKTLKCSSPLAWTERLVIDLPPVIKIVSEDVKSETTTQTSVSKNDSQAIPNHNSHIENHYIANMVDIEHVTKINNISEINGQLINENKYSQASTTETSTFNGLNSSQTRKPNQLDQSDQLKSLLDFQYDSQHHIIFNPPKNDNSQQEFSINNKKSKEKDITLRSMISERKGLELLNVDIPAKKLASEDKKTKKISKSILIRNSTVNTSDQRKLIEIFSQLSQKENNGANLSKEQNTAPMAQESVSMCIATGNLNGTENKTKCSQHPEIAPVPSEKNENKNIKPGRFIYRKNGNDKSSINTKPRKSKYVSRPNERYNITYSNDGKSRSGEGITIKNRQLANQTRVTESLQPLNLGHGNLYQHNLHGTTLSDSILPTETKADAKINTTAGINDNKINDSVKTQEEKSFELAKMEEQGGENVSEHQTSQYRAEASGQSGLGLGALVGVCGAACAALAGACLARRRPRGPRLGGPEMMEVQTITAVGELW